MRAGRGCGGAWLGLREQTFNALPHGSFHPMLLEPAKSIGRRRLLAVSKLFIPLRGILFCSPRKVCKRRRIGEDFLQSRPPLNNLLLLSQKPVPTIRDASSAVHKGYCYESHCLYRTRCSSTFARTTDGARREGPQGSAASGRNSDRSGWAGTWLNASKAKQKALVPTRSGGA